MLWSIVQILDGTGEWKLCLVRAGIEPRASARRVAVRCTVAAVEAEEEPEDDAPAAPKLRVSD